MPDQFRKKLVQIRDRINYHLSRNTRKGLNGLDDFLDSYLDFEDGYFIEAGANDGINQSNTYHLEAARSWKGLLIEPNPRLSKQCRWNRPRSHVVNAALVSDSYAKSTIELYDADLMSITSEALSQSEREHLEQGVEIQHLDKVEMIEVPAKTLTSILDQVQCPEAIDFFSLDVEGYELEVLSGLDLNRYKPRLFLIETQKVDLVTKQLAGFGYAGPIQATHHDYLYLRD